MSFVNVAPELVEAAAHDLAGIGSTLGEATGFAAAPTTSIAAAGTDEVSVAIAALLGNHGQEFQALTARAAAFHEEFVGLMKSGVGAYLNSEVANAQQMFQSAVSAPRRRERARARRRCIVSAWSYNNWGASRFTIHHGLTDRSPGT
jgi:hypothetical protein